MPERLHPIRVFLADDSAAIRTRIGALLAGGPVAIVGEAATPDACVEGILASKPQVVVLDVQLDGGTGLEVLRAVRKLEPQVNFIVFSNNSAPAYRRRYLAEGAARFIDKSTEFAELAGAIATAGGQHRN